MVAPGRSLAIVAVWAGATALAVGIATAGVNLVAQQVTHSTPVIIPGDLTDSPSAEASPTSTSDDDRSADPTDAASPDDDASDDVSSPPSSALPAPSGQTTAPPPRSSPSPRPSPSASTSDDDDEPSGTPSTKPSSKPSSEPSDEPSDHSSDDDDDDDKPTATETRTVQVKGGQASFRLADGKVELLWASPADGYSVKVLEQRDDRIELRFRSDDHDSFVEARAEDDGLDIETDEESRDDDD